MVLRAWRRRDLGQGDTGVLEHLLGLALGCDGGLELRGHRGHDLGHRHAPLHAPAGARPADLPLRWFRPHREVPMGLLVGRHSQRCPKLRAQVDGLRSAAKGHRRHLEQQHVGAPDVRSAHAADAGHRECAQETRPLRGQGDDLVRRPGLADVGDGRHPQDLLAAMLARHHPHHPRRRALGVERLVLPQEERLWRHVGEAGQLHVHPLGCRHHGLLGGLRLGGAGGVREEPGGAQHAQGGVRGLGVAQLPQRQGEREDRREVARGPSRCARAFRRRDVGHDLRGQSLHVADAEVLGHLRRGRRHQHAAVAQPGRSHHANGPHRLRSRGRELAGPRGLQGLADGLQQGPPRRGTEGVRCRGGRVEGHATP
mmetsp:Transcript_174635/g.559972  ORF Transcript_174635/g.559972 Transcript_174635/m.559972 type:complete len:369 (-) Transcript_174635:266-1372(-)